MAGAWTDDRLDDLSRHTVGGFERVDRELIDVRTEIRTTRTDLMGEMAATRSDLMGEIATTRTDLMGEIAATRTDLMGEIAATRSELRSEIMATRSDLGAQFESHKALTIRLFIGSNLMILGAILTTIVTR